MDHKSNSLIMHLREFPQLLADMDIPAPDRLTDELTGAIRLLESPGPFKALVHGDATFGNVFIQKRRALLVDLETATYRHILLDGAVPVIRYVWSAWCFRVPDDVRSRLLDTYCQEIAAVCPEAGDDELFGDHLTACCAAWFVGICSLIPDCIAQNKQWGRVTNRQRVILGLDHFSNYLEKSQQLPRLCQAAQALRTKLQSLWKLTIDNVPIYPAFRG